MSTDKKHILTLARSYRAQGDSYPVTARKVSEDVGYRVPLSTLQRWLDADPEAIAQKAQLLQEQQAIADAQKQRAQDLRGQGLTVQAIADALGVSPTTITRWTGDTKDHPTTRADVIRLLQEGHSRARVAMITGVSWRNVDATARALSIGTDMRMYFHDAGCSRSRVWHENIEMNRLRRAFDRGLSWAQIAATIHSPYQAETLRHYATRDFPNLFSRTGAKP